MRKYKLGSGTADSTKWKNGRVAHATLLDPINKFLLMKLQASLGESSATIINMMFEKVFEAERKALKRQMNEWTKQGLTEPEIRAKLRAGE